MNVNGIPPSPIPGSVSPSRGIERPNPANEARAGGRAATTATTGTDAPPPGADPGLWSVLTSDERAFFSRMAALGPVTYRPGEPAAAAVASPRGQRIDVRA